MVSLQRILKFLIFTIIFIICFSCAKPVYIEKYNNKKTFSFKGLIWWRIDLFKGKKAKLIVGFANFIATNDSLYIKLKTPIGSSLGLIKWNKNLSNKLKIYDFYHQRLYIIKIPKEFKTYEIPFYFLGLKKTKAEIVFSKFKISYAFSKKKKKGILISPYFRVFWIIKRLEPIKKKTEDFKVSEDKFKKILINFD